MPPTLGNGKICYLEIPAADITKSAEFYRTVFGWNIRKRGDGSIAFDDGVGEVSGTWVLGRPPQGDSGILIYIMVESVAATVDAIVANGGAIVQQTPGKGQECTATFRDPAGNLMGIGQQ
jgi:predicted enzyme related to lactoylglutathione lyase